VVVVVVTTPPASTVFSVTLVVVLDPSASRYSLKMNHSAPSMRKTVMKEKPCKNESTCN